MNLLTLDALFTGLLSLPPLLLDAGGPWSFPIYAIPLMLVMMAGMGFMMWLMMRMMMGMGGHGSSNDAESVHNDTSHRVARDREVSKLRAEVDELRTQLAASSREPLHIDSANNAGDTQDERTSPGE